MAAGEESEDLNQGAAETGAVTSSGSACSTVHADQVRHLFSQAPAGIVANACASVATAAVLWSDVASQWLLAWCLVQVATVATSLGLVYRYRGDGNPAPGPWSQAFLVRFLPNGMMWGAACLFMPGATPAQQLLVPMVMAGVCAGSVPIFASVLRIYCSYIAAILAPWTLWFLLHPASPHPVIGILAIVFGVMLAYTARNYSMSLHRSYLLAQEKAGLAAELQAAKDRVEAVNRQLQYEATHDALTGLVNRREFERCLHRLMMPGYRERIPHAVLYLDLDQFKIVNDACGHAAGDELLRQLTGALRRILQEGGTLARLGGDEFGVLLEHCGAEEAERFAWRLRDVVEGFRFTWDGRAFKLGVSIGVVPVAVYGEIADSVLRAADAASLAAKEAGGRRVQVYRPGDQEMQRRSDEMRQVAHIGEALDEGRFELYGQPIRALNGVAADSHRFELLLRMRETDGRLVGPEAFLPAAERYGLSVHIDDWVVDRLFRWAAGHRRLLRRIGSCSVNLSGLSLGNVEFLETLIARIADGPFAASQLCFEITETAAVGNIANAIRCMHRLRELGCSLALDDFGSGLSSFAYLKSLPVDYIKIDGMFVKNIADSGEDYAIVRSINELARVMGLRTVAEFVENERVLEKLNEIGIDYAQGYFVGMPAPLGEIFS